MWLPRLVLLLASLTFAGFGVAFAVSPESMARTIDIELPTDVARTDFIATYGGFELGMALFLFLCWRQPAWTRIGLIASGCAVGGFAAARLAGILTSATSSPLMLGVLAFEATATLVAFWAARLIRD
jgi:hypothetical protein